MTTIHWPFLAETFLVLLGAFGAGCVVACLFRRLVHRRPASADSKSAGELAAAAQPLETARFERALGGTAAEASASRPLSQGSLGKPVVEVQPPAPKIDPPSAAAAAPRSGSPLPANGAPPSRSPAPFTSAPLPTASPAARIDMAPAAAPGLAAAAAAAAAAGATVSAAPARAAPVPQQGGLAFGVQGGGSPSTLPPLSAAGSAGANDLTAIRAIDDKMQERLNRLGVYSYADLAKWSASDVNRMSQTLGFVGRIEQENWIEQAQILAKGGETDYSRRRVKPAGGFFQSAGASGALPLQPAAKLEQPSPDAPLQPSAKLEQPLREPPLQPSAKLEQPSQVPPLQPAAKLEQPSGAAAAASDSSRTFGVIPRGASDTAALAAAAAIAAAAAGAARSPPPAAGAPDAAASGDKLHRILGVTGDAERVLNANGVTSFAQIANWTAADADRFDRLLGHPGRIGRENWVEQAMVLARGAETGISSRSDRGMADAASAAGDDKLHRILGINAEVERSLIAAGVTRFAQIAAWTAADIERFEGVLGQPGRIGRENWVEQAKVLSRSASEPEASRPARLADAIRENKEQRPSQSRPDLGHLRSVRSEALLGDQPEATRASILTRQAGGSDDLKRIRGIGVLIEKKLFSLGVTAYEQIANWTGADIDRISQILDFKGRIERENWIEQARILAAGGHTEFSRRVDRGDVDSSKPMR